MYSLHNHTDYSNASRSFADCSHTLTELVDRARQLGLNGIAVTDHEITSSFVRAEKLSKELNFPIIMGNEIYLLKDEDDKRFREDGREAFYPHFILLALDKIGVQQIWKLSKSAWENSYHNKGLMRTPTVMSKVEEVVGANKGHLIASTACLGGFVSRTILKIRESKDEQEIINLKKEIISFINWGKSVFGEDNFYLECQPASAEQHDQIYVNNFIKNISKGMGVPYIITTDSHYLRKEDLPLHSAFLNAKEDEGDEREVETFYKTAYLMSENEVKEYFIKNNGWTEEEFKTAIDNTEKIGDMWKKYSLYHKPIIPKRDIPKNFKCSPMFFPNNMEYINKCLNSQYEQDRFLMYLLEQAIKERIPKEDYQETFERIELELTEIWLVSESIEDRMSAYFNTMNKNIEICWQEANAICGVGRGSGVSSIINYLLDITQINPLKMPVDMPFWRFIHRSRHELADIDFDTPEHKRDTIYQETKKYYESFGGIVVKCATFGTMASKSAVTIAGKGLGYDKDKMKVLSSLIATVRGKTDTISQTYYGDEKEGKTPNKEFVNMMNEFDGLLELSLKLEGLIVSRGTHASGIFIVNGDITEHNSVMLSPDGTMTNQYELHDAEYLGLTKFDYLTTAGLSKIQLTLEFLIEKNYVEWKGNLRDTYFSVLDPNTLDYDKEEIWDCIANNELPDLFQFDSTAGIQVLSKIKPRSFLPFVQSNSLMRLMSDGDKEQPTDRYVRYQKNINEWYKDLKQFNIPNKDVTILEDLLLKYNCVLDTQESIMILVMDERVSNFSVEEANILRKAVGKKDAKSLNKAKELFFTKGVENGVLSEITLKYLWEEQVMLQAGYAFSILHCSAYSLIALQELVLFTQYPRIFWYTSCLTVNSGSIDKEDEEEDDEEKKTKNKTVKYGKIIKAIVGLKDNGISISPPYINKAEFSFSPNVDTNEVIYSLKAVSGVGEDNTNRIIKERKENGDYTSFQNLMERVPTLTHKEIISLIKCGSFDEFKVDRVTLMSDYIKSVVGIKKTINGQNLPYLIKSNLIPPKYSLYIEFYNYKKYIYSTQFFYCIDDETKKNKNPHKWYKLDSIALDFFKQHFIDKCEEGVHYKYTDKGEVIVRNEKFNKIIDAQSKPIQEWMLTEEAVRMFNYSRFKEEWIKQCEGNISKWEMDALSYYCNEHELENVDNKKYMFSNFFELSEEPIKVGEYTYKGIVYNEYELSRICGTVIAKNNTKHILTILTTEGVVDVKFYSGAYSHYNKQISKINPDGSSTVIEKTWFKRGELLSIVGFRKGEMFVAKTYSKSIFDHTVQKIVKVSKDKKDIVFQNERAYVEQ